MYRNNTTRRRSQRQRHIGFGIYTSSDHHHDHHRRDISNTTIDNYHYGGDGNADDVVDHPMMPLITRKKNQYLPHQLHNNDHHHQQQHQQQQQHQHQQQHHDHYNNATLLLPIDDDDDNKNKVKVKRKMTNTNTKTIRTRRITKINSHGIVDGWTNMIRSLMYLLLSSSIIIWLIATTTTTTTTNLGIVVVAADVVAPPSLPQLNGQHFRITALVEPGFLDIDPVTGTLYGYLIDMIDALSYSYRANFTYELLTPSGYGTDCSPRLPENRTTTTVEVDDLPQPYDPIYQTQYKCGASDANDGNNKIYVTDMYLGMYYVTPARQLMNQFTIPFQPPFGGTLAMFGTATGIDDFEDLVKQQLSGLISSDQTCGPAGTALIESVALSYPGLQIRGIYGDENELHNSFMNRSCRVYITDAPIAAHFVLRRSRRNECYDNIGEPIGVIGKPMEFGLSQYAIGIRQDIDPYVTHTLSYWMNILMSCNPNDINGLCPNGNLATFYKDRGGTGDECGYVLYPPTPLRLSAGAITGIVIGVICFVIVLYTIWHRYKLERQRRQYVKNSKLAIAQAVREREFNEYMAHEIRNPLSSAIAAISFVESKSSDPNTVPDPEHRLLLKSDINVIDSSLQYVNELLRNMLDLHRTQLGHEMKLNYTPTDILHDIFEPIKTILFMRGNSSVTIETICIPTGLTIMTDRMRLKQIILNLAANSCKFVQSGYIRLRAEVIMIPTIKDNNDNNDVTKTSSTATPSSSLSSLTATNHHTSTMRKMMRKINPKEKKTIKLHASSVNGDIEEQDHQQEQSYKIHNNNNKNINGIQSKNNTPMLYQQGNVVLYVEDSGPGIPEEKRKQLFAKFQDSLDVLNQGTGIGLSVCKNLSELMNIELSLDDTYKSGVIGMNGTSFRLQMNQSPLMMEFDHSNNSNVSSSRYMMNGNSGDDEGVIEFVEGDGQKQKEQLLFMQQQQQQQQLPEHMKVLFVDDDLMLRKMFTRVLKLAVPEWSLKEAANGETALKIVDDETFDIIFIDQYMASVEKQLLGTETVRALRAKGVKSIICGLSANNVQDQFYDAGANAFMSKPFPCKKDTFTKELHRVIYQHYHTYSTTATATTTK